MTVGGMYRQLGALRLTVILSNAKDLVFRLRVNSWRGISVFGSGPTLFSRYAQA